MLPKILKKDIRMQALYELTVEEFNSLRIVIKRLDIMDVYNVDASFLPWLAWWFRVDAWNDEWSEERQRESIANALILRKYKGTIWAVEHALELSLFEATVVPWYEMLPEGERGTFRIDTMPSDSRSLTQSDYATFITLTESNKQGSQHWIGNIKHDPSLGSAYAAPVIRTRKRWVSNSVVPPHVVSVTITADDYELYEHEREMIVSATVIMSDGSINSDVIYISSDESIVTVDNAGRVRFVAEGVAVISAISTFDNISRDECVITTFAISFVLEVGKDGGGNVGYMSNTAGGVQPDDWCASSPAKIGYLQYIRSGDVAFSTASPKHWSLLWNDFVSVKFKFANESDNHTSEPLQQSESANYRAQSDIDTYNFLSRIVGSHVNVYVKNGESSNVQ